MKISDCRLPRLPTRDARSLLCVHSAPRAEVSKMLPRSGVAE